MAIIAGLMLAGARKEGRKESDKEWEAAMRRIGLSPEQIRAIRQSRFGGNEISTVDDNDK